MPESGTYKCRECGMVCTWWSAESKSPKECDECGSRDLDRRHSRMRLRMTHSESN